MLSWLLACAAPDADTAAAPPVADPGPAAPIPPSWTVAELEARVADALDHGIPEPATLRTALLDALEGGEDACPAPGPTFGLEEACTTASGWTYFGISTYVEDAPGAEPWSQSQLQSTFRITEPTGAAFTAGGEWSATLTRVGAAVEWEGHAAGSFAWPSVEGWLGEGASVALALSGTTGPDGQRVALEGGHMTGGPASGDTASGDTASGDPEAGGLAFWWDALAWDSAACDGQPTFTLQLRDPAGPWYQLQTAECGACADVTFEGEDLGEACFDLGPALATLAERMATP